MSTEFLRLAKEQKTGSQQEKVPGPDPCLSETGSMENLNDCDQILFF